MKKFILHILLFLFTAGVLAASVRGLPGNPTPTELNSPVWKENGPLELSPERGRYALLYSLAENKSFSFSPDLARFAAPDVGYLDGKYVSLFAPGVSFLVIPGFLIGKSIGLAQVGAFAMVAAFALMNMYLIRAIAIRLGANALAATVGGIVFLFASPAFAYAVTLYQHHISTFLILASIYLLLRIKDRVDGAKIEGKNMLKLGGIWALMAVSLSVDYPNLFLMLPIAVLALLKTFPIKHKFGHIAVKIPFLRVLALGAVIFPMLFFFWFNQNSYGNPTRLAGTVERAIEVKEDGKPLLETEVIIKRLKELNQPIPQDAGKSALGFFKARYMINGVSTHLWSADRGLLVYTPIMLFGFIGAALAFASQHANAFIKRYAALLLGVFGFNLLLYSMWDDPYGGWAFGSRYLIPSYAVLSVFIALALTRFARYNLFLLFFFLLFVYSTGVNTVGAITSNRNPPKVEAQALERETNRKEEYTFMRNVHMVQANMSKSFVFERYASSHISAWDYYVGLVTFIIIVTGGLIFATNVATKSSGHKVIKS